MQNNHQTFLVISKSEFSFFNDHRTVHPNAPYLDRYVHVFSIFFEMSCFSISETNDHYTKICNLLVLKES